MPETPNDLLASPLIAPREGVAVTEFQIERVVASLLRRLDAGPLNMLPSAARDPLAFARLSGFGEESPPAYEVHDGVALLSVKGVLLQEAWDFCGQEIATGYDRIGARAAQAFEDDAVGAVLLDVHSPGGMAVGNIELARELRAAAEASGKPLIAFAGGQAASAAYAISAAADEILTIQSGFLGCIGTICTAVNTSEALSREGLRAIVAASPPGKAAEHPMLSPQNEGQARMQREVEALSALFAGHVAERRRMSVAQVMALDAESFIGAEAVDKGLADKVMSRGAAIAHAQSKIKKRAYSMPGNGNEQQYGQAGASLLRAVGLDPSANLSTADIEAACKRAADSADIAAKLEQMTGAKGSASIEVVKVWQGSHASVSALVTRVKTEALRGRFANRVPPAEKWALSAANVPDPSAGLHERFAEMSLDVFDARMEASVAHPSTSAAPQAQASGPDASESDLRAKAKAKGVNPDVYVQAAKNLGVTQ